MIHAGEMRDRADILTLTRTDKGWRWTESRRVWCHAEKTGKLNLFSTVGAGAEGWLVTMRRCGVTPHMALRVRGRFFFITDVTDIDVHRAEISCAAIEPSPCLVTRRTPNTDNAYHRPTLSADVSLLFPAPLTEKYAGFTSGNIHDTTTLTMICVCPKPITLRAGEIVMVSDKPYRVETAHEMSQYKNEYEITREADT